MLIRSICFGLLTNALVKSQQPLVRHFFEIHDQPLKIKSNRHTMTLIKHHRREPCKVSAPTIDLALRAPCHSSGPARHADGPAMHAVFQNLNSVNFLYIQRRPSWRRQTWPVSSRPIIDRRGTITFHKCQTSAQAGFGLRPNIRNRSRLSASMVDALPLTELSSGIGSPDDPADKGPDRENIRDSR